MSKSLPFIAARVDGDKELLQLFEQLPRSVSDKALKDAGKKALKPVADAAVSKVRSQSYDTGDLADHIVVSDKLSKRQKRRYARPGDVAVYAGPTYPAAAHAHLIEFGTADRTTKSGADRGRVAPEPFLRPAWDAHAKRVLDIMRDEIWNTLAAAVRRLRKRADKGKLSRTTIKQIVGS